MTKAEFLTKVANYEASPKEWKFLGDKPCIVDFYASWCGPCKMLSPLVDEIAGESDAYRVCKINVDDAPEIAARYRVMSIPTLIVFRSGDAAARTVGVQSKQTILNMLK